jgi:autotransporter-associated beta strand protein
LTSLAQNHQSRRHNQEIGKGKSFNFISKISALLNFMKIEITARALKFRLASVALAAFLVMTGSAFAASGTWTANADGNWHTTTNWSGGIIADGATFTGDFSTLNISANRKVTIDGNVASRTLGILNIGDTTGGQTYTIESKNNGKLTFNNGGSNAQLNETSTSGGDTLNVPLVLTSSLDITNASANTLTLSGVISGGGALSLLSGSLTLSGANTYTGGTSISSSTVVISSKNSVFGTNAVTVTGSSTFSDSSDATIANNFIFSGGATLTVGGKQKLTINGTLTNSGGNGTLTANSTGVTTLGGNVYLSETAGTGRTLTLNGTGPLTISGVIADFNGAGTAGSLVKSGTGTLTLSGANTYSGNTTISAGTLELGAANVIPDGVGKGNVSVSSGATLDLNNFSETINGLSGAGTVDTLAAGTPTLTVFENTAQTSTFSGVIKNSIGGKNPGTLALTKTGDGTLSLTGANTYSGATTVSAGTLVVGGSLTSAITVNTGGTLAGNGSTTGAVAINNGFISPGNSVGTFTTTSSLSIATNGVYTFELNSDTSTADKIVANGISLLSGSTITFTDLGSTPLALGTTFTILDNTSAGAISGTFANLTNGQIVAIGPNSYQASYFGGTPANNLILTAVVPEPSTWAMLVVGAGLLVGAQRLRRKQS